MQIGEFKGERQGQAGPGFSWLTFNPDADVTDLTPKSASSPRYTFTEEDKKKVMTDYKMFFYYY